MIGGSRTWSSFTVSALAVSLLLVGYVTGSVAPLPWLRAASGAPPPAPVQVAAPVVESATPMPTPTPTASETPTPTVTVTPSATYTPFPTPTERVVPPQPTRRVAAPTASEAEVERAFGALREVWDLIHAEYINRPVDDVRLVRGAIKGLVRTLEDPHSSYMDPTEFKRMSDELANEFEGIGAEVGERNNQVVIISPIPDSPAEKAGLRPGDAIIKVDDRNVTGMSVVEVGALVRGPAGTVVRLTVQRAGVAEPLVIPITRARIVQRTVEQRALPPQAQAAGLIHLRLTNFGQNAAREMRDTLRLAMAARPRGLILDLRGNPGGGLFTAIEIASQFVGSGAVMLEEDANGKRQTYAARPGGLATDVPLVVLVDGGSASAAEIVAGAIQDHGRGTLIGDKTFGKGTVQHWLTLQNEQGGVRLTIARWLTPRGTWVHGQGITPDLVVTRTTDDRTRGVDPQLDRAVQFLLERKP